MQTSDRMTMYREAETVTEEMIREFRDASLAYWQGPKARWSEDALTRPVCITACAGAYGPCCYVVAINGTPPKALYLVLDHRREDACEIHVCEWRNSKRPLRSWSKGPGVRLRYSLMALVTAYENEQRALALAQAHGKDTALCQS